MKTGEIRLLRAEARYRTIGHKPNDDITGELGLADTYIIITEL
jgi:hypothetical protein